MATPGSSRPQPLTAADHHLRLPIPLLKSESVPPAPNPSGSGSTIDWLPDFAGHSWIAYGASSLLCIAQFPSPSLSSSQGTDTGPIFRQSFELCSGDVSAVAWSLAPGAPFSGDLAAAAGNRIFLFEYNSSQGSFCWSQSALLLQSAKVEDIKWSGSGDGIVAGGIDVVLWKRGSESWEIAWKFEMKQVQTLVSTTWFIEGLLASGTYGSKHHSGGSSSVIHDVSYPVNVFEIGGKSGHFVELPHPQPVFTIQWRPSRAGDVLKGARSPRHILVTSCLDGSVRFWGEIDDGRIRKSNKDVSDSKLPRRSFYVVATIEINHALNGTLGTNIFVNWALELGGIVETDDGAKLFSAQENHDNVIGRCEWLVAVGPDMMLTFWAIHCLDDVAPMRCPRLSLWKRKKLLVPATKHVSGINGMKSAGNSHFCKASILRDHLSGPPKICSVVYSLPCNTLGWSTLCTGKSNNEEEHSLNSAEIVNCLSSDAGRILNVDGHTGEVLQVALHPCNCEVDLAVSLDSNGLILLWSLSPKFHCISDLPNLNSHWNLIGNVVLQDVASKYKSIAWAPSWLDGEWVLLLGHAKGIDCCLIRNDGIQEGKILFHKLCTIPFCDGVHVDGPDKIFAIPLRPNCEATFNFNTFMLIGAWGKGIHAFSWNITLHSYDLTGSCSYFDSDVRDSLGCSRLLFETNFAGKSYCVIVHPCSQFLPGCNTDNHVTCVDVAYPSMMMPSQWQNQDLTNESPPDYVTYSMVTGHADGTVRLWRSRLSEFSAVNAPWELMGMFVAHHSAVHDISVADCGQKIATICSTSDVNSKYMLSLWEPVNLGSVGCFILEDQIALSKHSNALSWFTVGNGKAVLGVCFENELHVYSQRRSQSSLLHLEKPSDSSIWICISVTHSSSVISGFLWGPCATAILVHGKYFSLYGPYGILMSENNYATAQIASPLKHDVDEAIISVLHADSRFHQIDCNCSKCIQTPYGSSTQITRKKCALQTKIDFLSILELAESLSGLLPFCHPEVLLMNIYSGNWKRAHATMCHAIEYLALSSCIEKDSNSSDSPSVVMQVRLPNYFEGFSASCETSKGFQWAGDANLATTSSHLDGGFIHTAKDSGLSSEFSDFLEILDKSPVPLAITDKEKMQTYAIVDLLKEISSAQSASVYEGLDDLGRRFWCSVRIQQLDYQRRLGRLPSTSEMNVNSRLIAWAFHSDCQENLFNAVLPAEPSWEDMRNMGFGYWFTNAARLRTKMEKLARSQYLKSKDPKACALLYIALNRLQVLAGLFKISRDEKDKPLVGFLSRNFKEEKHKAAALKNAYVLMGRHQLELATAFFLLGGDAMSAVNVCAKTLGDEQLALVICRLVEGQGGTLEHHLTSKFILPSAVEKGDRWLSSILEWSLGNYSQAFLSLLAFDKDGSLDRTSITFKRALLDPCIGHLCQNLAVNNSLRNAVGEQNAATLLQWAIIITTAALDNCGLPLEALECLSSSSSNSVAAKGTCSEGSNILPRVLRPTSVNSSNWVSVQVALHLDNMVKSDLAMQYISKLVWEYQICLNMKAASNEGDASVQKFHVHRCWTSLEELRRKLNSTVEYLERKFALIPVQLLNKILFSLSIHGLLLIGYHVLSGLYFDKCLSPSNAGASFQFSPNLIDKLHGAARDSACLFQQFIAVCSMASFQAAIAKYGNEAPLRQSQSQFIGLWYYTQGLILSLNRVEASLILLPAANIKDRANPASSIIKLCKYCACLALATLQCDRHALVILLQPLMASVTDEKCCQLDLAIIEKILSQVCGHLHLQISANSLEDLRGTKLIYHGANRDASSEILGYAWEIAGACLWKHMSVVMTNHLNQLCDELADTLTHCGHMDQKSLFSSQLSQLDNISAIEQIQLLALTFAEPIGTTVTRTSSYYAYQLAFFLWKKAVVGTPLQTLLWLEEFSQSQRGDSHEQTSKGDNVVADTEKSGASSLPADLFLNMCAETARVPSLLTKIGLDLSHLTRKKSLCGWKSLHTGVTRAQDGCAKEFAHSEASGGNQIQLDAECQSRLQTALLDSDQKDIASDKLHFKSPREVYRKNGELFEALCINSIDQQQASLAIDRKGIVFFNWDIGLPSSDHSEYVWSEADWPQDGWAGTESTPVPTCVSYGVGLGSKKEGHLGLGGATVGLGSAARPRSDLTGGGAFGIPGYAGMGASGLGWEIQEDFEKLIDPLATIENVSTQALSAHPSTDLFLVGSRNTHIYLWKYGEEKATATYGVLPAANVPPPYYLASVTALQFDRCGQRFANAASDGTVCTWQLDVGGRTNVRPTESSICFNGHASDISYVSVSGSIIAVSGYSSNGVNVVVWDTLAPPATSRASVMCHEGGASSIAVFDSDVGSGSISPLIVTGGKGGDVGLHDFRYIATGKTKRHRHPNSAGQVSATSFAESRPYGNMGDHNRNGMLWYIPNAHAGSITKLCTIPNTSLFLTGGKDGDVKLWDAKKARMVFHWPKLHERHLFLQRGSSGFGSMTRVALTDIQVTSNGFLSCGGDGSVKFIQLGDFMSGS